MRIVGWASGIVWAGLLGFAAGCGSAGSGAGAGAEPDASDASTVLPEGGAGATDGGASDAAVSAESGPVFPASHPAIPHVISGGKVMAAPKVVSVSFQSDPLEGEIDAFASAISTTTYWGDRTAEYGIGPIKPLARIHDTTAMWPSSIDDSQIQTWLMSQLDGTHPEWPVPDDNTVYALYFPPGVSITNNGEGLGASCGTSTNPTWHGYHDQMALAGGTRVVYATIARCDSIPEDPSAVGIQYVSAVASHELIEAITDPFVTTGPLGYSSTDADHIAFSFASLAELGDMCALVGNAFYTPPDFPYLVQRIWSNKVAPSGHDPCLPEPAGQVYFNSAPVLDETVRYPGGITKGVTIPVGQTKTVEVDLFSEGPTPGPWTVRAFEVQSSSLTFAFDKTSGGNGDKLQLSITAKSVNPNGPEIFMILSELGALRSVWVGMVVN